MRPGQVASATIALTMIVSGCSPESASENPDGVAEVEQTTSTIGEKLQEGVTESYSEFALDSDIVVEELTGSAEIDCQTGYYNGDGEPEIDKAHALESLEVPEDGSEVSFFNAITDIYIEKLAASIDPETGEMVIAFTRMNLGDEPNVEVPARTAVVQTRTIHRDVIDDAIKERGITGIAGSSYDLPEGDGSKYLSNTGMAINPDTGNYQLMTECLLLYPGSPTTSSTTSPSGIYEGLPS
jgi:hypothetical protein